MKKIMKFLSKLGLIFIMTISVFVARASLASATVPALPPLDDPTDNQRVTVRKDAKLIEDKVNIWDVSLQVKSKDIVEQGTTNIVLVLDQSGSMDDYMSSLKTAANQFVDIFLNNTNVGIAMVSFDTGIHTFPSIGTSGFAKTSAEKTALKTAILGLDTRSGDNQYTFTQGGIYKGKQVLDGSSADREVLVLFSDGQPNRRYPSLGPSDPGYPGYNYSGSVTDNGNFNDHAAAGLHAAGLTKAAGYMIHTIGFRLPDNDTRTFLTDVAGNGGQFHVATETNIAATFANLATAINTDYGITDGQVVDIIAPGFSLVGTPVATHGTVTVTGNTITWDVGNMAGASQGDIKHATLTYRLEINDSILLETPSAGGLYPTNASATLSEKGEQNVLKTFPVPEVDPVFVKITKTLVDENDQVIVDTERLFDIEFTPAFNALMKIKAGETVTLTSIRDVGTYTFSETGVSKASLSDYAISYTVGGVTGSSFTVTESTSTTQSMSDIELGVLNKFTIPTEDMVAEKRWDGGNPNNRPEVDLQLYRQIYGETREAVGPVVTLDGVVDTNELSPWKYTWTNLPTTSILGDYYDYSIEEVNTAELEALGYFASYDGLLVINDYVVPFIDVTGTKMWSGGLGPRPTIMVQLYKDGDPLGEPVEFADSKTEHTWEELPKTDEFGVEFVYTIDELETPSRYTKTFSNRGLTITNTWIPPFVPRPTLDIEVNKLWLGGSVERPEIEIQLFRDGIEYLNPVLLESGQFSYTFEDLLVNDGAGHDYVYTIDEVQVPEGYVKEVDGFTIMNRFVSSKINVMMTKVWEEIDSDFPDIEVQLYRNGEAHLEPVTLSDGATFTIWEDLDEFDFEGVPYVYTVDEVEVPEGFIKVVDGLEITNILVGLPDTGGEGSGGLPDTSTSNETFLMVMGAGAILSGLYLVLRKKLKKEA